MIADLWAILREPLNDGDRHPTLGSVLRIFWLLICAQQRMGKRFPRGCLTTDVFGGDLGIEWNVAGREVRLRTWPHGWYLYYQDHCADFDIVDRPRDRELVFWLRWMLQDS